jgi:hypothetical protein
MSTEEIMTMIKEIILEKRYPHSREEDITDAFMRGYEIGKEQEHRWWSTFCANCKDEPNCLGKPNNCETCANGEGDIEACGYCRHGDLYEPKTEQLDKDTNVRSKEPQTEPQVIACPIQDDDSWIYGDFQKGIYYAWGIAQKVFDSTVTFYEAEDVAKQIDKEEPQTEREGE